MNWQTQAEVIIAKHLKKAFAEMVKKKLITEEPKCWADLLSRICAESMLMACRTEEEKHRTPTPH